MLPVSQRESETCPCLKLCKSQPEPGAKEGKKEVRRQGLQLMAKEKETKLHLDMKEAKAFAWQNEEKHEE